MQPERAGVEVVRELLRDLRSEPTKGRKPRREKVIAFLELLVEKNNNPTHPKARTWDTAKIYDYLKAWLRRSHSPFDVDYVRGALNEKQLFITKRSKAA